MDFNSLGSAVQKLEAAHVRTAQKKSAVGDTGVGAGKQTQVAKTTMSAGTPNASDSKANSKLESIVRNTEQETTKATLPRLFAAPAPAVLTDPAIMFAGPTVQVQDITPRDQDTFESGFIIDTSPTPIEIQASARPIIANRVSSDAVLGQARDGIENDDDDEIVYDAPFPQSANATDVSEAEQPATSLSKLPVSSSAQDQNQTLSNIDSTPKAPSSTAPLSFENAATSLSFTSIDAAAERNRQQFSLLASPRGTGGPRRVTKLDRRAIRTRVDRNRLAVFNGRAKTGGTLGALAAMLEERHLHDDELEGPDPRRRQRRVGDSDLEWGDTSDDAVDRLSSDLGGMDIDPDVDESAYGAFLKRMAGVKAGEHVTMDDLADLAKMREEAESDEEDWKRKAGENGDEDEDDEDEDESDDEEVEAVLKTEEALLVAEPGDGDEIVADSDSEEGEDDDENSEDEDETPRRGFKKRLELVRAQAAASIAKGVREAWIDDDSDDDQFERNLTWAEKDDDYLQMVQVRLCGFGGLSCN